MSQIIEQQTDQLIKLVENLKNDLQGFQRAYIVDNLKSIAWKQRELIRLLEMVLEDCESGEPITKTVINAIKYELIINE